ncbi:V4R domain-containing protein [uncultured Alsobacter sp.]|uniref:V4R domain-containing protein n=1 Tax=uncultured Alsobacter sp. TaxID=1748258 RepID=UPI0025F938AF|nr:V4R domain-containing protein [uncultured Alsobacter sp.]
MSSPSFRERLVWEPATGEILDQTRRYFMLRPDGFMGMFKRLDGPTRIAALEALEASIFEGGSDSARAYRAMGGEGADLARIVAATAPQLGWGTWEVTIEPDRLFVAVRNSPFAEGYGPSDIPVCAPMRGMVRAVATLVFDKPAVARETACAAMGAPLCTFEARPA